MILYCHRDVERETVAGPQSPSFHSRTEDPESKTPSGCGSWVPCPTSWGTRSHPFEGSSQVFQVESSQQRGGNLQLFKSINFNIKDQQACHQPGVIALLLGLVCAKRGATPCGRDHGRT